ncbi:MAG: MFS transporter [Dehalococcoidia bacterium]|nr:MFS transporter [Dehalococcoidia bacterium]
MSTPRPPAPRRRWLDSPGLLIGALAFGWAMIYMGRSLLSPLLPVIGEEFQLSGTERGAIASTYFALYAALQIPSGLLGDRLGLKRVMVAMYLLSGLGLLAIGLLGQSYALLLLFIGVHASGAGAYYSGSYGLTVSGVPIEKRGASAALVSAGMGVGLALGLSLAEVLHRALDSWRLAYVVMAGPTLLAAFVFWRLPARASLPGGRDLAGGVRFMLRDRNLLPLCLAAFCLFYAHWVLLTWVPSFLFEERGVSLAQAGPLAAVIGVPTIVGALVLGRLSDRVGRKRVLVTVIPFLTLSILGLALFQSTVLAVLSLALYGLVGALALNPLVVSWAGDHILATKRVGIGTGIAVFNTFAVGSSVAGPLLSGWVLDATGSLKGGFLVAAGFATASFFLMLLPKETVAVKRRGSTSSP